MEPCKQTSWASLSKNEKQQAEGGHNNVSERTGLSGISQQGSSSGKKDCRQVEPYEGLQVNTKHCQLSNNPIAYNNYSAFTDSRPYMSANDHMKMYTSFSSNSQLQDSDAFSQQFYVERFENGYGARYVNSNMQYTSANTLHGYNSSHCEPAAYSILQNNHAGMIPYPQFSYENNNLYLLQYPHHRSCSQNQGSYQLSSPYHLRDPYHAGQAPSLVNYPNKAQGRIMFQNSSSHQTYEGLQSVVLSADSLEHIPFNASFSEQGMQNLPFHSFPAVQSPPNNEIQIDTCENDSLEDLRHRPVSELTSFFENKLNCSDSNIDELNSVKYCSIDKSKGDSELATSDTSIRTIKDNDEENSSDAKTETCEPPVALCTDSKMQNNHIGDVNFIRATIDTPLTLLTSTKLVKAMMKPPLKPTTFYIALDPKFEISEFPEQEAVSETGTNSEQTTNDTNESIASALDSSDFPADYQESQLLLKNFVSDWRCISLSDENDSDVDEFFLVLDSSGGNTCFDISQAVEPEENGTNLVDSEEHRNEFIGDQARSCINIPTVVSDVTKHDGQLDELKCKNNHDDENSIHHQSEISENCDKARVQETLDTNKEVSCCENEINNDHNDSHSEPVAEPFLDLGKDEVAKGSLANFVLQSKVSRGSCNMLHSANSMRAEQTVLQENGKGIEKISKVMANNLLYYSDITESSNLVIRVKVLAPKEEYLSKSGLLVAIDKGYKTKILRDYTFPNTLRRYFPIAISLSSKLPRCIKEAIEGNTTCITCIHEKAPEVSSESSIFKTSETLTSDGISNMECLSIVIAKKLMKHNCFSRGCNDFSAEKRVGKTISATERKRCNCTNDSKEFIKENNNDCAEIMISSSVNSETPDHLIAQKHEYNVGEVVAASKNDAYCHNYFISDSKITNGKSCNSRSEHAILNKNNLYKQLSHAKETQSADQQRFASYSFDPDYINHQKIFEPLKVDIAVKFSMQEKIVPEEVERQSNDPLCLEGSSLDDDMQRKSSDSSGVSSFSEDSEKRKSSTIDNGLYSDYWEWFPKRDDVNCAGLFHDKSDCQGTRICRKDSTNSSSSNNSSGISSLDNERPCVESIANSPLPNIKEEKPRSIEDNTLNIFINREPILIPSSVCSKEVGVNASVISSVTDTNKNRGEEREIGDRSERVGSDPVKRRRRTLHIFENIPSEKFGMVDEKTPGAVACVRSRHYEITSSCDSLSFFTEHHQEYEEDSDSIQGMHGSSGSISSRKCSSEDESITQNDIVKSFKEFPSDGDEGFDTPLDSESNSDETDFSFVFCATPGNVTRSKEIEGMDINMIHDQRWHPERGRGLYCSLSVIGSKSLPNLSDIAEANVCNDTCTDSAQGTTVFNLKRLRDYFSASKKSILRGDKPKVGIPKEDGDEDDYGDLEEQEISELFSEEDLLSDLDFEPFSETEMDTDMENLNFEIFEPKAFKRTRIPEEPKHIKRLTKLKRKLSFSSLERPKVIKGVASSLQRLKKAKGKIGEFISKTLKPEVKSSHLSYSNKISISLLNVYDVNNDISIRNAGSSLRACIEDKSYLHCTPLVTNTPCPSEEVCDSLSLEKVFDSNESSYSWSDADSDFEFVNPKRLSHVTDIKSISLPRGTKFLEKQGKKDYSWIAETARRYFFKDRDIGLGHSPSNRLRNAKIPLASWEPFFSVLRQDEKTFTAYRSEEMAVGDSLFYELPRVRLDGGAKAFRGRWGYEVPSPPALLEEENENEPLYDNPFDEEFRGETKMFPSSVAETSSLRGYFYQDTSCGPDRRGSAPATPILGGRFHPDSSSNRLVNFFNKRSFRGNPLKRTKSVTKLEKGRPNEILNESGPQSLIVGSGRSIDNYNSSSKLRSSRSHESLLNPHQQMMHTLDMAAGEVTIRPLHPSILGQDHCFLITSPSGSRYYSCRNAQERDKWVEALQMAVNPERGRCRRRENSLKIFILEAKKVTAKKRYFCELLLDDILYARTASKRKGEMCFWGEQFEFKSLPSVETISINLYREGEKRRKKERGSLVGTIKIPVSSVICGKSQHEKWFTLNSDKFKNSSKEQPSLRIKYRYQSVDVLPLEIYSSFLQFVKTHYMTLCSILEPVVNVKVKEDLGTILVKVMQKENLSINFLGDLVMQEIDRIDDCHLLFRGNSLATKAMEAFMKLVGESYLLNTLRPVITQIVDEQLDCEVDRTKVTINALQKNQENLMRVVRMTWSHILNSYSFFPEELRRCFCLYRERLMAIGKGHLSDNLISASIFLRFLCPAILSPSLFNIIQEYPDEKTSRNLTLIAKTLQTLANFTKFQGKENFMEFMNEFIEREQIQMKSFLSRISSMSPPTGYHRRPEESGKEIDLGIQLSLLHTLLSEAVQRLQASSKSVSTRPELQPHLEKLQRLLDEISDALNHPNINIVHQMSSNGHSDNTLKVSPHIRDDAGTYSDFHSLQQNIFKYNDPTADRLRVLEDRSIPKGFRSYINEDKPETSPMSRSSTLPRTLQLLGSAQKPAADLSTADDYVLFTALDKKRDPKTSLPVAHSYNHLPCNSELREPPDQNNPGHHQHFLNHAVGRYGKRLKDPRDIFQVGGSKPRPKDTQLAMVKKVELDASFPGDGENNVEGSQISISQLSNIASSGYQSFAYSQSSSPTDQSGSRDVINNNINHCNPVSQVMVYNRSNKTPGLSGHPLSFHLNSPLAFNNPMYHMNNVPSSPKSFPHSINPNPNLTVPYSQPSPISSSLSSSHSNEDLPHMDSCHVGHSPSSEDSASFPCGDHYLHYGLNVPRTNPRYGPSCWNGVSPKVAPNHHYSASELVETQKSRPKAASHSSKEVGAGRRIQRRKIEESDSSSDDQRPQMSRPRLNHLNKRTSDTKTLDEYEKEILALQSSMEMQLKLVSAEEELANGEGIETDSINSLISQSNCHRRSSSSSAASSSGEAPITHYQLQSPSEQGEENCHMEDILASLLKSHEELLKEQQIKTEIMHEKDVVIHAQEERIAALNKSNTQLLMALSQMQNT